jgi:predicted phage tail protein
MQLLCLFATETADAMLVICRRCWKLFCGYSFQTIVTAALLAWAMWLAAWVGQLVSMQHQHAPPKQLVTCALLGAVATWTSCLYCGCGSLDGCLGGFVC